jgi:hypothetical protein
VVEASPAAAIARRSERRRIHLKSSGAVWTVVSSSSADSRQSDGWR